MKFTFPKIKLPKIKLPQINVPHALSVWLGRAGALVAAAALDQMAQGRIPTSKGAIIALVGTAVTAAAPNILTGSGIFRPATSGQPSLAQTAVTSAVQGIAGVITAKGEQRKAAQQQATADFVEALVPVLAQKLAEKTGQFSAAQLGFAATAVAERAAATIETPTVSAL
jgi:hypothetical protein